MFNEDNLKAFLSHLFNFKDCREFYKYYIAENDLKSIKDFDDFLIKLKFYLIEKKEWNGHIELVFRLVKEQANLVKHYRSTCSLSSIDKSRKLKDSWLTSFHIEFNQCLTGDRYFEKITPKKYKTIEEYLIMYCVDDNKVANLYLKYSEYNHPYINYCISNVFLNGKKFSIGLPILFDGIKSIVSFPNYYWNNENGVEGATWLLFNFLILSGNNFEKLNLFEEKIKLLKLIFLYMGRYIYMTRSNLNSLEFYSNRARLINENYTDFIGIFGLSVNPDIQFVSDKYLAYKVAMEYNLGGEPIYLNLAKESRKMYEHGSHIPFSSIGYKEIEDRTFMECVKIGEVRSKLLTVTLLKEFENYDLNLSNLTLEKLFNLLIAS